MKTLFLMAALLMVGCTEGAKKAEYQPCSSHDECITGTCGTPFRVNPNGLGHYTECTEACDPTDPTACPSGGTCVLTGYDQAGQWVGLRDGNLSICWQE